MRFFVKRIHVYPISITNQSERKSRMQTMEVIFELKWKSIRLRLNDIFLVYLKFNKHYVVDKADRVKYEATITKLHFKHLKRTAQPKHTRQTKS